MKLISLNIWGGRVHGALIEFIKRYSDEVDIFCFQEALRTPTENTVIRDIHLNIYEEIKALLPDHVAAFAASEDNYIDGGPTNFPMEFGQAMFIRKSIEIKSVEDMFVHKHRGAARSETGRSAARAMQYASVSHGGKNYTVFNYHGLHNGDGKSDSDERFEQSKKIGEILASVHNSAKIVCGDLNLLPDTKSLGMLEGSMRNLIKEHGVTSTRSSYYEKPLKFADYILVDKNITVNEFAVLKDEVSDHLAMCLDFN